MSDLIKRQDVLQEIRAEIKHCEEMHVNVSEDSLIRIVEQAEGFNSNEHFAKKIIKELEKVALESDEIMVDLDSAEDRRAQLKKSEAYRYAKEIVVNVLGELKRSGGWTPCYERMPKAEKLCDKKNTDYLVERKNGDMEVAKYITMYGKEYFSAHAMVLNDVVAWRHLPPHYKPFI